MAESLLEKEIDVYCHPADYKLPFPSHCLDLNVGANTVLFKIAAPFTS